MNSTFRSFLAALVVSGLATAGSVQGQTTVHTVSPNSPPIFTGLGFGYGPWGTLISAQKDAPFAAEVTQDVEQTLSDGTTIHRESIVTVMRDSAGRIYRTRSVSRAPEKQGNRFAMITIIDTPEQVQYVCNSVRKACTKMTYHIPPTFHRPNLKERPGVTVEDLGTSEISGIEVEGTRVTRTLAEGKVGNDRPITITEESWYSKPLDVNIQFKRSDPRMGLMTSTMASINPGEPDPKYFQIPDGYKVEERKTLNGMEPAAGGSAMVEVEVTKKP